MLLKVELALKLFIDQNFQYAVRMLQRKRIE